MKKIPGLDYRLCSRLTDYRSRVSVEFTGGQLVSLRYGGHFGNAGERERPPLEASTKRLMKGWQTEKTRRLRSELLD